MLKIASSTNLLKLNSRKQNKSSLGKSTDLNYWQYNGKEKICKVKAMRRCISLFGRGSLAVSKKI